MRFAETDHHAAIKRLPGWALDSRSAVSMVDPNLSAFPYRDGAPKKPVAACRAD